VAGGSLSEANLLEGARERFLFSKIIKAMQSLLGSEEAPNIGERRDTLRLSTRVEVTTLVKAKPVPMTVVDIGLEGLRLQSPCTLAVGTTLSLEQPGQSAGPVQCVVRWCRQVAAEKNFHSGLAFADSNENKARSWIKPVLEKLGLTRRMRKQKRQHLRLLRSSVRMAVFNLKGDFLADGSLLDLSRGGARFLLPTQFVENYGLRLALYPAANLAALEIPGTVIDSWKDDKTGQFIHRLQFVHTRSTTLDALERYLGFALKQQGKAGVPGS
jgi:hypothetical protein